MRRNIVIPVEVASRAEFDDVFFALHLAVSDRIECGDERGNLMQRTLKGFRTRSGFVLPFGEDR